MKRQRSSISCHFRHALLARWVPQGLLSSNAMLHPDGSWFKDDAGRTLLLRGVNLGGDSKVPTIPDGATHHSDGFFDHRMVSFVGRPFPLSEAYEHLSRLKSWGLTLLRFLVTWEAIEPVSYTHLRAHETVLDIVCRLL